MKFSTVLSTLAVAGSVLAAPTPVEKRTSLNDFLSLLLEYLPAIDVGIADAAGLITDFENLLSVLTGWSDTYNQLSQPCTDHTVIFARGTSDPGNTGILVGPPFFTAISALTSSVRFQGVNGYAATVDTFLEGGDPAGMSSMASEIQSALAACPNTKLVVSGYSQGGQVVHGAIAQLSSSIAAKISSVVIFGDPEDGTPIQNVDSSRVDVFCSTADDICDHGDLILPAHLLYAENAAAAAAFVMSK